jgi:hypothetical protein
LRTWKPADEPADCRIVEMVVVIVRYEYDVDWRQIIELDRRGNQPMWTGE